MKRRHLISNLLLIMIMLISVDGITQPPNDKIDKRYRKEAAKYFRKGEFIKVLESYKNIDTTHFEDDDFFKVGMSLYRNEATRDSAITYLENYIVRKDTESVAYMVLGELYQLNYRFDTAVWAYDRFQERINIEKEAGWLDPREHRGLSDMVSKRKAECNYGKSMLNTPRDVIIENLGDSVNSEHDEYAPAISFDEKFMAFTSRRPNTTGGSVSPDGDYYEDIYWTELLEGSIFDRSLYDSSMYFEGFFSLLTPFKYTTPKKMPEPINTKTHDASILLDEEGSRLYFYRSFDIWYTDRNDEGVWQEPIHLEDETNSDSYDPSVVISYDHMMKFIASEREGGEGGLDIYVSWNSDTGWSHPENLGPAVNTKYDEDVSYYSQYDSTLYFSSKGHSGMGGYDIFKTTWRNGHWTAPVNMGYPVNTPFDDVFYMMTPKYNRGYYSSDRRGGKGGLDIFRLTFSDERNPLAEIKGLVLKGDSLVPAYSKIEMISEEDVVSINHESDSLTGDYLLLLPHGKRYTMRVETEDFVPYTFTFVIPEQRKYYQLYQEIHHVHLKDDEGNIIGQKVTLENAFFDLEDKMVSDSLTVLYKDPDRYQKMLDRAKSDSDTTDLNLMADVKFYMTEDSLIKLINSQGLEFVFPKNTNISFLKDGVSQEELMAYANYVGGNMITIDEINGEVILVNQVTNKDTLDDVLENIEKEKFPKVIVYFDFNSVEFDAGDQLDFFVKYLANHPELQFKVVGHTDSKGAEGFNQLLSKRRAKQVSDFLIKKGIDRERFKISGKGESEPVAPNTKENGEDHPEGRRLNRRVEFILIK